MKIIILRCIVILVLCVCIVQQTHARNNSIVGDDFDNPIFIGNVGDQPISFVQVFNMNNYSDNFHGENTNDVFLSIQSSNSIIVQGAFKADMGAIVTILDNKRKFVNSFSSESSAIQLFEINLNAGFYYLICENKGENDNLPLALVATQNKEICTPSKNRNYIFTTTPTTSSDTVAVFSSWKNANHHISYYDHLGRSEQDIDCKSSPMSQDIIIHQEYDWMGRKSKQWLPFTQIRNFNNSPYLPLDSIKSGIHRMYTDSMAYTRSIYEATPFERITEVFGPGQAWQNTGHSTKHAYRLNNNQDQCLYFSVNGERTAPTLRKHTGIYPPKELEVIETKDEDGNPSYQFTDKRGNVLLKRQLAGSSRLDTYYLYDDFNNLCFVLPPTASDSLTEANKQSILDRYAYQYRYDHRNRCIGKKLPGCAWIEMIYDSTDQLIFTQNGEQKKKNEWSFQLPDVLNREVVTGIYRGAISRATISSTRLYATFASSGPAATYGYTIHAPQSLASANWEVLLANYYDNYDYQKLSGFNTALNYTKDDNYGKRYENVQAIHHCKGLITGCMTRVLENSQRLYTSHYYDYRRNLIQSRQTTINGKMIVAKSAFDFSGRPTVACEEYANNTRLQKRYTYDHAGRPIEESHILNGATPTRFKYKYDELGRVQSMTRTNGTDSLTTSNQYNIRNWLTAINSPVFNQNLQYFNAATDSCYNGNISSMSWKVGNEQTTRGYKFTYDALSRLKNAIYGEGNTLGQNLYRFNEQVTGYDKMGNILGLKRSGQISATAYGLVDNLTMTYNGNQLKSVNDNVATSVYGNGFEFKDGKKQAVEYTYDDNGNIKQDLNKKITDIQYNYLNLPSRILFEDGSTISYNYSINGAKLRTTHVISGVSTTTDYCGNVIYENGNPKTLLTGTGYVSLNDNKYHYYVQDHQGNNRVVVNQNGTIEEANHYYPFGGLFGNTATTQPFKYNGKELDRKKGLDWYDYEARHYDAAIGRWHAVDSLAEKYYSFNSYVYCGNNPIRYIDPDGNGWDDAWPFLKNSLSVSFSIGAQAKASAKVLGFGVELGINGGSAKIGDGPLTLEKGASATVGFFSAENYTKVYDSDARTSIRESGYKVGIPIVSEDHKKTEVFDSTGKYYQKTGEKSSVKTEYTVDVSACVILGVDVSIDLSKVKDFVEELFK